MKKNWKTTVAGILGGFLLLVGPQAGARLTGDPEAPPITSERLIIAAALASLGFLSKDKDVTGVGMTAKRDGE